MTSLRPRLPTAKPRRPRLNRSRSGSWTLPIRPAHLRHFRARFALLPQHRISTIRSPAAVELIPVGWVNPLQPKLLGGPIQGLDKSGTRQGDRQAAAGPAFKRHLKRPLPRGRVQPKRHHPKRFPSRSSVLGQPSSVRQKVAPIPPRAPPLSRRLDLWSLEPELLCRSSHLRWRSFPIQTRLVKNQVHRTACPSRTRVQALMRIQANPPRFLSVMQMVNRRPAK